MVLRFVSPVLRFAALAAAAVGFLLIQAAPSSAAVIDVDTTADQAGGSPGCSLRQAISAADLDLAQGGCGAGAGADTIRVPAGTYTLTRPGAGESLNQTGDLNLQGTGAVSIVPADAGKVVINAGELDRVLSNGGGASLSIRDLTVSGGRLPANDGGGILNAAGSLTLDGVTVTDNSAEAGEGGGVANYDTATFVNTTISGNTSKGNGGGYYAAGGTTVSMRSTTVSGNAADAFGTDSGDGGGIAAAATGTINAFNSVIAGNEDNSPAPGSSVPDCVTGPDFYPRFTMIGVRSPASCLVAFDPGTNLTGDPGLGPLGDNGGQTPTLVPQAGSALVDAGGSVAPDTCPLQDQRGVARPQGAGCDIGAVERDPAGLDAPPVIEPPVENAAAKLKIKARPKKTRARAGKKVAIRARVRNTGDATARRGRVCLSIKGKGRRSIKRIGKRCRRIGAIRPAEVKTVRLRLRVKPASRAGKRTVRLIAKAKGAAPAKARVKLRVR